MNDAGAIATVASRASFPAGDGKTLLRNRAAQATAREVDQRP